MLSQGRVQTRFHFQLLGLLFTANTFAQSPSPSPSPSLAPVTVDNFVRAESDMYLGNMVKDNSLGKFTHRRSPSPIDNRTFSDQNRDTLFSAAVFDLAAGPVTITLPDGGKRFISMQLINQDHYVPALVYGSGPHTFDSSTVGSRYAAVAVRIVVDPADPNDIKQGNALQDAIKIEQSAPGKFEVPNWDQVSQKRVRDAVILLGSSMSDFKRAFGTKDQVDPVRHLIGTALAWGSSPVTDAAYRNVTPGYNDGTKIHKIVLKDMPPDLSWSIEVVTAKHGDQSREETERRSLTSLTARPDDNGAIVIQFGGCDEKSTNCLPIKGNWSYVVRQYRPQMEAQKDKWFFPTAQPAP